MGGEWRGCMKYPELEADEDTADPFLAAFEKLELSDIWILEIKRFQCLQTIFKVWTLGHT